MRRYAKISPQMWIGDTGRQLREAGPEALLVALYLLSNPHANMLGLYYLPTSLIAHETGLAPEGASKGLRRAIEAGFCSYDESSEMVFVHEMARYQIADQLATTDKQCTGIQREYEGLPNNPFLAMFYEKYAKAFHLTSPRENRRTSEGPSMAHRSQEQEQEQEKTILSNSDEFDEPLRQIFNYYLERTCRNPKTYAFTDYRKKKARTRLRECLKKTGGNISNAISLMNLAVDGLAQSDWHMGRNAGTNGHKYCEWEKHLFESYEQMEGWWNRAPENAADSQSFAAEPLVTSGGVQ